MNKGITVAQLFAECEALMEKGYGDKVVLISDDDEGNGFHTLIYSFVHNAEDVNAYADTFHHRNNPSDVVLLG